MTFLGHELHVWPPHNTARGIVITMNTCLFALVVAGVLLVPDVIRLIVTLLK